MDCIINFSTPDNRYLYFEYIARRRKCDRRRCSVGPTWLGCFCFSERYRSERTCVLVRTWEAYNNLIYSYSGVFGVHIIINIIINNNIE